MVLLRVVGGLEFGGDGGGGGVFGMLDMVSFFVVECLDLLLFCFGDGVVIVISLCFILFVFYGVVLVGGMVEGTVPSGLLVFLVVF